MNKSPTLKFPLDRRSPAAQLAQLQRARHLQHLADRSDRALLFSLAELATNEWNGPQAELAKQMLNRNLEQLRRAAANLRDQAERIEQQISGSTPPNPDPAA